MDTVEREKCLRSTEKWGKAGAAFCPKGAKEGGLNQIVCVEEWDVHQLL